MRSFKSTTAILAALSLTVPAPLAAQGQGQGNAKGLVKQLARDLGVEVCEEGTDAPCVAENGALMIDQPDIAATLPVCDNTALPCATEAGMVLVEPSSDLAMQALAMASDPANEEAAEAPTDETAEEPAEETAEAPVEGTEATADADAVTTIEADTAAETETPPAEGETTDLTTDAGAINEGTAEETANVESVETESSEEDASEAEVVAETDGEANTAAEVETTQTMADSDNAATAETTEEMEAPGDVTETAEAPAAESETVIVEEAPAAAAAADDSATTETAEVETEDVTEDTARSSSEDFQTSVTGGVTAEATTPDDDGLSNFEKALLIGLGAIAVGSILDNGDEVVSNSGDRVVLQDNQGNLRVLKNDDALLRQPGSQVQTETFNDGSTRTTVTREDGTKIVTIRDANGRVLRRVREFQDGSRVVLFDDTEVAEPVDISTLPEVERTSIDVDTTDEDALRRALAEAQARDVGRRFSLSQVRQIREVRELAPELDLDAITFATGSAAIDPSQAEELTALGRAMSRIIQERPGEVFLIEGHTDAVGSATYNLALSDRRAETVALALTEYFDVPPENMITQGYGESALKIQTDEAERLNRRATIRRITPLLRQASLDR